MVRANYGDCFFVFFLISFIYCFYWGKMHNCAHPTVLGTRVLGWNVSHVDQNLQLQSFPLSPCYNPLTLPDKERIPHPLLWVETTRR